MESINDGNFEKEKNPENYNSVEVLKKETDSVIDKEMNGMLEDLKNRAPKIDEDDLKFSRLTKLIGYKNELDQKKSNDKKEPL